MNQNKHIYNTEIGNDIYKAAAFLKSDELVGIPTETVYGLAGNALSKKAVLNIFETKGRPTFNPLIVHVGNIAQFELYAENIPQKVYTLAQHFCPGPITFLLQKKGIIPDIVTSGLPSVALRIPSHSLTLELLHQLSFPLAAPSANPFGYISPTNAKHVYNQLNQKIPYILDGGACTVGLESTIISFVNDIPEILRFGGISQEEIEKYIGKVNIFQHQYSNSPSAPGMLKSHYAPNIPLYFGRWEDILLKSQAKSPAVIAFNYDAKFIGDIYILSENQDLKEAASNLFDVMRKIDALDKYDCILATPFPDNGLGLAINDRLKRASVE